MRVVSIHINYNYDVVFFDNLDCESMKALIKSLILSGIIYKNKFANLLKVSKRQSNSSFVTINSKIAKKQNIYSSMSNIHNDNSQVMYKNCSTTRDKQQTQQNSSSQLEINKLNSKMKVKEDEIIKLKAEITSIRKGINAVLKDTNTYK